MIALFIWTLSEAVGLILFVLFLVVTGISMLLIKLSSCGATPTAKCCLCGRAITGEAAARKVCGMCRP